MSRLDADDRLSRATEIPTLGSSFVPGRVRIAPGQTNQVASLFQESVRLGVGLTLQQRQNRERRQAIEESRRRELEEDTLNSLQQDVLKQVGEFQRTDDTKYLDSALDTYSRMQSISTDTGTDLKIEKSVQDLLTSRQSVLQARAESAVVETYNQVVVRSYNDLVTDPDMLKKLAEETDPLTLREDIQDQLLFDLDPQDRELILDTESTHDTLRGQVESLFVSVRQQQVADQEAAQQELNRLDYQHATTRLVNGVDPSTVLREHVEEDGEDLLDAAPAIVTELLSRASGVQTAEEARRYAEAADKLEAELESRDDRGIFTQLRQNLATARSQALGLNFSQEVRPALDLAYNRLIANPSVDYEHLNRHMRSEYLNMARREISPDIGENFTFTPGSLNSMQVAALDIYKDSLRDHQVKLKEATAAQKTLKSLNVGSTSPSESDLNQALNADTDVMAQQILDWTNSGDEDLRLIAGAVNASGGERSVWESGVLLHAAKNGVFGAKQKLRRHVGKLLDSGEITEDRIVYAMELLKRTSPTDSLVDNLQDIPPNIAFAIENAESTGITTPDEFGSALAKWDEIAYVAGSSPDNLLKDEKFLKAVTGEKFLSPSERSKLAGLMGASQIASSDREPSPKAVGAKVKALMKERGYSFIETSVGSNEYKLITSRQVPEVHGVDSARVQEALNTRNSGGEQLRNIVVPGTTKTLDVVGYEALKQSGLLDSNFISRTEVQSLQDFKDQFAKGRVYYAIDSARVNVDGVPIYLMVVDDDGREAPVRELTRVDFNTVWQLGDRVERALGKPDQRRQIRRDNASFASFGIGLGG